MSEIEKLYDNAGVETKRGKEITIDPTTDKVNYHNVYYGYPPFTAEKQLSLIKFLFNHNVYYDVDDKGNYWFHITDDCYTYYYNKFEIALANIINEMWQDLTESEREQIAEILRR